MAAGEASAVNTSGVRLLTFEKSFPFWRSNSWKGRLRIWLFWCFVVYSVHSFINGLSPLQAQHQLFPPSECVGRLDQIVLKYFRLKLKYQWCKKSVERLKRNCLGEGKDDNFVSKKSMWLATTVNREWGCMGNQFCGGLIKWHNLLHCWA